MQRAPPLPWSSQYLVVILPPALEVVVLQYNERRYEGILKMQHVTIQWYRGIRVGRRLLPSGRHERWKSRLTFGQMC